ncbi:MAG: endonuclease/exonuclease/phosphatase family protein [Candidatus Omnitrophica bacterium]|nr:endonuclease/exonuclease/phosphatase family protein [Candidatus Omnitrophota bacterium]
MKHRFLQKNLGLKKCITFFLIGFFLCPYQVSTQETNPAFQAGANFINKNYPRYQAPEFLSFQELKRLAENPEPSGLLEAKLKRFWKTPIISNEAYYRGAKPHRPSEARLGRYLRVVTWNIEKSIHMDLAIKLFTDEKEFLAMINSKRAAPGSEDYQTVLRQREKLLNADIILLQEIDIGVKRSGYIHGAQELAKALNMNYAYGTQQLEIDPVTLGVEKILLEDGSVDEEAMEYYAADPNRYRGAFGSAVLSKYPIKHVKAFQLKNQAYDWYSSEKQKTTFLENTRRFGAKTVFKNELTREIKVGGRIFFRVDLDVPDLPHQTLTVVNIHLEIRCQPEARQSQMVEILGYIEDIKNPVIVAGDFNSAPGDLSPTSVPRAVKRTVKDPTTWFSAAVTYLSPHALVINTSRLFSNVTKNFQDPTAKHIPVIAVNKVKGLFEAIEEFRFSDGSAFDFRGDANRSVNREEGTLANSNQRDFKGFKTTFSVKRPIGPIIGKYRLDWFFVKSFLKNPRDRADSYRFAPHFGETLEELNMNLLTPISDHHPSVVDIPFNEPKLQ